MEHVFIACPDHISNPDDFERKLFILRNYATHTINQTVKKDAIGFYVASLSYKVIVYKGQLTSMQVRGYFPDLSNKRVVSAFGLVHSRFATIHFLPGNWRNLSVSSLIMERSIPAGNLNWLKTSEKGFTSPYFSKEEMDMLLPVITEGQSDSACLDNIIELLSLTAVHYRTL